MPDGGEGGRERREGGEGGREGREGGEGGRMECTSKPGLSIYLSVKLQTKNETTNHNTHTYTFTFTYTCADYTIKQGTITSSGAHSTEVRGGHMTNTEAWQSVGHTLSGSNEL